MSEEQPIATAFSDAPNGTHRHEEFVFAGDIFWGTIYKIPNSTTQTRHQIETNNIVMIENIIEQCLPTLPAATHRLIARFAIRYPALPR